VYKKAVKLAFHKGAALPDPKTLFNSSLEENTRRAIDIPEGVKLDPTAFKALFKTAVALNLGKKSKPTAAKVQKVKQGSAKKAADTRATKKR